jgi:hypothetical protein
MTEEEKRLKKKEQDRLYYLKNKEKVKAKVKEYRENNLEAVAARNKSYYENNKEKHAANGRKWYEENGDIYNAKRRVRRVEDIEFRDLDRERSKQWKQENRERYLALQKQYRQNNPHKVNFHASMKRSRKRNATPNWLTEFDLFVIEEIYDLAILRSKAHGIQYHVDHIIPLKGVDENGTHVVCGLHVPSNLRIIPAKDNLEKLNRYVVE